MPGRKDGLQQTALWFPEDDLKRVFVQETMQEKKRTKPLKVEDILEASKEQNEQPPGDIASDGAGTFTYTGYILEDGKYICKTFTFTCHEGGVYPNESLDRVCAMLDRVGRDEVRQEEIRRFGKRIWHSPYRPEAAALQGLDYIFRHDVGLVAKFSPYVSAFYAADSYQADRWTCAMYNAYRIFAFRPEQGILQLLLLLREVGASPEMIEIDGVEEEM